MIFKLNISCIQLILRYNIRHNFFRQDSSLQQFRMLPRNSPEEPSERACFLLRFSVTKRENITTLLAALRLPPTLIPLNTPRFSPFSHARYLRYLGDHCTQTYSPDVYRSREGSIKFKGLRKSFFCWYYIHAISLCNYKWQILFIIVQKTYEWLYWIYCFSIIYNLCEYIVIM